MQNNFQPRREAMYYDATREFYITRNMDVAAYLELKLGEAAEAETFNTNNGEVRVQFRFQNSTQIRDLLEHYDNNEAQVEPKAYSEVKMRIITARRELMPKKA